MEPNVFCSFDFIIQTFEIGVRIDEWLSGFSNRAESSPFTYAAFGFILILTTAAFHFMRKKKGRPIACFSVAVLAVHPA